MRLKAICKNGTNKIITSKGKNGEVNISQIAKALHHDRDTAKTYLEASERAGLIISFLLGLYLYQVWV